MPSTSNPESKPFTRCRDDRVLAGVLGGLARRLGWNATFVRVAFVLVSAFSAAFPGMLVYLILWFLIPEEPQA
jgi:phage shock protein C